MVLTLFLAFYPNTIPFRLVWLVFSIFFQFLALVWYTLSYIPFARQIAFQCLKKSCCGNLAPSQVTIHVIFIYFQLHDAFIYRRKICLGFKFLSAAAVVKSLLQYYICKYNILSVSSNFHHPTYYCYYSILLYSSAFSVLVVINFHAGTQSDWLL